jgi:hypothetical protein
MVAFLQAEPDLIGIGDDLVFVALARALVEGMELPTEATARMRELLHQLERIEISEDARSAGALSQV